MQDQSAFEEKKTNSNLNLDQHAKPIDNLASGSTEDRKEIDLLQGDDVTSDAIEALSQFVDEKIQGIDSLMGSDSDYAKPLAEQDERDSCVHVDQWELLLEKEHLKNQKLVSAAKKNMKKSALQLDIFY